MKVLSLQLGECESEKKETRGNFLQRKVTMVKKPVEEVVPAGPKKKESKFKLGLFKKNKKEDK